MGVEVGLMAEDAETSRNLFIFNGTRLTGGLMVAWKSFPEKVREIPFSLNYSGCLANALTMAIRGQEGVRSFKVSCSGRFRPRPPGSVLNHYSFM